MTKIPLKDYPRMFSPAENQDKDGFKLENVRPTFSSFAVITHKKSVVLSILVQPFVLQSLLIFL